MRHLILAAVGLLVIGLVGADEPKKDEPKAEPGALKKAKAEYDAWLKAEQATIAKARPGERQELQQELNELMVIKQDNLYDVAAKEPDTKDAYDIFAGMLVRAANQEKQKTARMLIIKHHLTKAHVKSALPQLAQNFDDQTEVNLTTVAVKNEDKECQAIATITLGMLAQARAKGSSGESKDELLAKAEKAYKAAKEKYADIAFQGSTVGKIATARLESLKVAGNLTVGKQVPDITGEDLDGKTFKLSEQGKGKVVVLNFWATWCGPCMALVPHEREMVEKMKGKPFELIGINGDPEITEQVKKTIEDKKITWRSFKGNQKAGSIPEQWELTAWPTIYVIDHKGVIRHTQIGGGELEKLDKLVEELVAEAEKK